MKALSRRRPLLLFFSAAFLSLILILVKRCEAIHTGYGDMHSGTYVQTVWPESEPEFTETDKKVNEDEAETGADPVQFYNGCFVRKEEPVKIASRGIDTVIRFTYRSQSQYNSCWGFGWHMNYDQRVRVLHNGNVVLLNGEGDKIEYVWEEYYGFNTPAGLYDDFWQSPNGTFTRRMKHGLTYRFNVNGTLASIKDRNGNQITFTYDPAGKLPVTGPSEYFIDQETGVIARDYRLTKITDTVGREINLAYDENGRLSTITDFAGRTWTFGYDSLGNRTTLTTPSTTEFPDGLTTTYGYTDSNDPHNLTTITDPEGQLYLTNQYNWNDCVVQQTYGEGTYTFTWGGAEGPGCTFTDREGNKRYYGFGSNWNIAEKRIYYTDEDYYSTTFVYNDESERTKVTYPRGNSIEYTYDDKGNVTEIRRKAVPGSGLDDIVTSITYEYGFNFPKTYTDPRGNVTTFEYDYENPEYGTYNGNLMKITLPGVGGQNPEITFTYNEYGQITSMTDPNGKVLQAEYYEDTGYLKKVIRSAGDLNITSVVTYDAYGNIKTIKDPRSNITDYGFDALGLLKQITAPSPLSYVTTLLYDGNKNIEQINRETGNPGNPWQTFSFTYNNLDKIETVKNDLLHQTTFGYDYNDNLSSILDAENNSTTYQYNERDLIWKVTDNLGGVTESLYDENGNLTTLIDSEGNRTKYIYDGYNRVATITYGYGTAEASAESFTYDENGNITSHTTRKGDTIQYTYDELNRLDLKTYPDLSTVDYTYDLGSRLTDITSSATGNIHYTYDGANRITSVTTDGKTGSYQYDANGNRTMLTYPDNDYITYEWDKLNRLDKVKDSTGIVIADYTYDKLSRRTQADFLNGTRAEYVYDAANRLTSLVNKKVSPETTFSSFSYSVYDNVRNLKEMTRGADSFSFTYDDLYRLTNADYPAGSFTDKTYNYDNVGNRTSVVNGGIVEYTTNALNQYNTVGVISYTYDGNGNLISDGTNTYAYDYENRLISTLTPSGTFTYTYDPWGRRIRKQGPGVDIRYVYDGAKVIEERDASDNVISTYIYGAGIDECIRMERGGTAYYYHYDRLGSIMNLTDSSGNLVESYAYDVWGNTDTYGSIGNPYFFTGRRYDPETGLYYYRARMYDPGIGRFLQVDPIGYWYDMNLYSYVTNNPVNFIDPFGWCKDENLSTWDEWWLGAGLVTIATPWPGDEAVVWTAIGIYLMSQSFRWPIQEWKPLHPTGSPFNFDPNQQDPWNFKGLPDWAVLLITTGVIATVDLTSFGVDPERALHEGLSDSGYFDYLSRLNEDIEPPIIGEPSIYFGELQIIPAE